MKAGYPLITIQQAAQYLNINRFTIYRMIAKRRIPALKVGNQWRFKQEMIDAWLEEHSTIMSHKRR